MKSHAHLLLALFLGTLSLHAEKLVVPVIGKGWQIDFEGPRLHKEQNELTEDGLKFQANAGLFNVSVFVEAPAGKGGHKECREHYWAQGSRNPMIDKTSIQLWSAENCECVEYTIQGEFQGQPFTQANINCYFVHEGRWMDVHASFVEPKPKDVEALKKLAKSLVCRPFADSQARAAEFDLPGLGSVKMQVPAGWSVGNQTIRSAEGMPDQHTISLFFPTDMNKNWKLTFFRIPTPLHTVDEIKQTAQNAQESAASSSVEGKSDLKEVKLKRGVGCHAEFTDSSLAGKPVEPGNAKVISSGFIAPQPDVLGSVTIFADDKADKDFQAAIQALESIEFMAGTKL